MPALLLIVRLISICSAIFPLFNRVFVINLDRSPERLGLVTEKLDGVGINFERVAGVDGKLLQTVKDFSKVCEELNWPPFKLNFESLSERIKAAKFSRHSRLLGEIGCQLSHAKVLKIIVESAEKSGQDEPTLILEDDVVINPNFRAILNEIEQQLPEDWDMLLVGGTECRERTCVPHVKISKHLSRVYTHWGKWGYIVKNSKAAKILQTQFDSEEHVLADYVTRPLLKSNAIIAYIVQPQLFAHGTLASDINLANKADL